jgi:hypothetical protein
MICYMHEGNPYGHLKVADKVILPANLARMVGETLEVVEGWLEELRHAGVYDTAEDGSIYSRRMIRDENLRQIRANGGKLGGNPNLKPKDKVNLEDNQKVNQKPTPSSSSSSSIINIELPSWLPETHWKDFVEFDPQYLRPTEVDALIGDPSKTKRVLGWEAKTHWKELAELMVDADLQLFQ